MITIGIASVPARAHMLIKTIESLLPQCDRIFIALNSYSEIPNELINPKIHCDLLDNTLGDSAKILHARDHDCYFFSVDDDLVYPKNYCEYMISKIEQYGCIVTLHGRKFNNRPLKSCRRGFSLNYHCLHSYNYDAELDIGGSGVMAYHTSFFKPDVNEHKVKNMCDIWIAKQAHKRGVKIMGVAHIGTYLKYLNPQETIWQTCKIDGYMTQIANSFLK